MKLSAQVRSTHSQDGAVVLDILHGQMFSANIVGSRILELLKQDHTKEQIADALTQEFHVPREAVVPDLEEFLDILQKHRLVRPGMPAGISSTTPR